MSTIAVLNTTGRIIVLKAQVRNKKDEANPIRFKFPLQPGIMNMVPRVMWAQFKRNDVVKAYLDEELLIAGKDAEKEEQKAKPKVRKKVDSTAATLAQIESNASGADDDNETES